MASNSAPKQRHWNDEDVLSAQQSLNGDSNQELSMKNPIQQISSLKEQLVKFWSKHETGFVKMWQSMNASERTSLIRTSAPYIPLKEGVPYVDGEFVGGVMLLCPELCVEKLIKDCDGGLIHLIHSRISKDLAQDDLEDFAHAKSLISRGLINKGKENEFVRWDTGERFRVNPGADPTSLERIRYLQARGAFVPSGVYDSAKQRQISLLQTLMLYCEEYRSEILGKGGYKKFLATMGCSNCGAATTEDGKSLKFCSRCSMTAYCGRECQKKHWKVHKPQCNSEESVHTTN